MNIGHWFNPCDYNSEELTERILDELGLWDQTRANIYRLELIASQDLDEYMVILDEVEREAIDALNEYAPVDHWIGYDEPNSFGCYPIEED